MHGITLKSIVIELQEYYGWEGLAQKTRMNCFKSNPSIKSSLTFLRKTDWARDKIEQLYLFTQREIQRARKDK
ncbi:VF530 family DNA-binding protein [Thiomicrorhabdus marina]|uniref:VF530 family protein n=1 Tax=Thiomicrorhabdus marina TaxID=2818442 RepID=UPI001FB6B0AC|nr:VF530 family protein [Thiomicrorhabdus marina]